MKKRLLYIYFLLFNLILFGQNNLQFAKQFSSSGSIVSNMDFIINDALTDENGSTYFFGFYQGTVDFDPNASLVVRTSYKVDVGWSLSTSCASDIGCFRYNGPLDIIENDLKEYNFFPNIVTGSFEIASKEIINQLTIYHALGQKTASFISKNKYCPENLSSGIYTLEIITDGNKKYSKMIKTTS